MGKKNRRKKRKRRDEEEKRKKLERRGENDTTIKHIPGFEYDKEKKRYFPIGTNPRKPKHREIVKISFIQRKCGTSIAKMIMSRMNLPTRYRDVALEVQSMRMFQRDKYLTWGDYCAQNIDICEISNDESTVLIAENDISGTCSVHKLSVPIESESSNLDYLESGRSLGYCPFLKFGSRSNFLANCTQGTAGRVGCMSLHRVDLTLHKVEKIYEHNMNDLDGTFRSASWCQTRSSNSISLGASQLFRQSIFRVHPSRVTRNEDVRELRSDSMSQAFKHDDTVLFTGCRNGSVIAWDHHRYKGSMRRPLFRLDKGSVASILPMNRNAHRLLIANSRWGLFMYDLRFTKDKVMEFFPSDRPRAESISSAQFPWIQRYKLLDDKLYTVLDQVTLGCWNMQSELLGSLDISKDKEKKVKDFSNITCFGMIPKHQIFLTGSLLSDGDEEDGGANNN